jgi:sugar phosphate isomerase/epimerase
MLQIRIGVDLASLHQPFKQALLTARTLGAQAVEIDAQRQLRPEELTHTGVRHVRKMLEDLDLRVCAVAFATRRGYHTSEGLEARLQATQRAMRLAYDLGAQIVSTRVGQFPSPEDRTAWELACEVLEDLGRYGQKVGAFLALQTGPPAGEVLAPLLARLPEGSLGVDFHPGRLILHGQEPRKTLEMVADHVWHVHAVDATRDPARHQACEVPLGQGIAEFPELLAVLEEHHYRGYLTVAREQSDAPLEDLAQAIQFLRNL